MRSQETPLHLAIRRGAALNSTDRGAIHSVFKKVYKAERINPAFSKIANMIIPGSGQIYSGDFKNGLNLTLLLSLLGLLAVNTGVNYSFMDAVITIMPWYQRYYMGGYTKAEQIGIKRKDQKQEQLKSELLHTDCFNKKLNLLSSLFVTRMPEKSDFIA